MSNAPQRPNMIGRSMSEVAPSNSASAKPFKNAKSFSDSVDLTGGSLPSPPTLLGAGSPSDSDAQANARRRVLNRLNSKLSEEKTKVEDQLALLRHQLDEERTKRRSELENFTKERVRLRDQISNLELVKDSEANLRLKLQELTENNDNLERQLKDANDTLVPRSVSLEATEKVAQMTAIQETMQLQLTTTQTELEKLKTSQAEEAIEFANQMQKWDLESAKLQDELARCRASLEEKDQVLVNQQAQSQKRMDEVTETLDRLRAELDEVKNENAILDNRLSEMSQTLELKEQVITDLRNALDASESGQQKLREMQNEAVSTEKGEVERLLAELEVERTRVTAAEAEVDAKLAQIEEEQGKLHLAEAQLSAAEAIQTGLESELEVLRAEIAERISREEELVTENKGLTEKMALLTAEIARASEESASATQNSLATQAEAQSSKQEQAALQAEVQSLLLAKTSLSAQLDEVQAKLEEEHTRNEGLLAEISALNDKIESLDANLAHAAAENEALEHQTKGLLVEREQFQGTIAELEAEKSLLEGKVASQSNDDENRARLVEENARLTADVVALEARLEQKDLELQQLHSEIETSANNPVVSQLSDQVRELSEDLVRAKNSLEQSEDREKALALENAELNRRISEISANELSSSTILTETVEKLSNELHELERQLAQSKEREETLRGQLIGTQAALKEQERSSAVASTGWEQNVTQLKAELEEKSAQLEHERGASLQRTQESEETIALLEKQLADKNVVFADQLTELEGVNAQLSSTREQLDLTRADVDQYAREIEQIRQLKLEVESDRDRLHSELEASEELVSTLNQRVSMLEAEAEVRAQMGGATDERTLSRVHTLEQSLQTVKEEKSLLEKELERSKDRVFVLEKGRKNIEDLETSLRTLEQESARSQTEVQGLKDELKTEREKSIQLEESFAQERAKLMTELTFAKSEVIRVQNVSKQQAQSRSAARVEDLERQVQDLKQSEEQLRAEELKSKTLAAQVADLTSRLDNIQGASIASQEDLKKQLQIAEAEIARLKNQETSNDASALQSKVEKLQSELDTALSNSRKKETELIAAQSRIQELTQAKAKKDEMQDMANDNERALASLRANHDLTLASLTASEAECTRLRALASSAESRISVLEEEVQSLKQKHVAHDKQRDNEFDMLKAQLQTTSSRLDAAQAKLVELQGDGGTKVQSQLRDERERAATYERRNAELTTKLQELQSQQDDLANELARVGKLLNEEQRKEANIRAENEDLRKKLDRALKDIDEAAAPSIRLGEKIMSLTEKLDAERERANAAEAERTMFEEEVKRLADRLAEETSRRERYEKTGSSSRPRRASVIESSNV